MNIEEKINKYLKEAKSNSWNSQDWVLFDIKRNRKNMSYTVDSWVAKATSPDTADRKTIEKTLKDNIEELKQKLNSYQKDPSYGDEGDAINLKLKAQIKAIKKAIKLAEVQLKNFKKSS